MISKRIQNKVQLAEDILNKINKPLNNKMYTRIHNKISKKKLKPKDSIEVDNINIEYFNFYESLTHAIDNYSAFTSFNKNINFQMDNDNLEINLKKEKRFFTLRDSRFEKQQLNYNKDLKLLPKQNNFKFFNQDDFKNYNNYF